MTDERGDVVDHAGLTKVREYYRLVDADDVPGIVALFAEDAVYRRPGYEPMRGHADLRSFYGQERVIADGTHTLTTVVTDGRRVAVHGVFDGVLKNGRQVTVEFADFFELNEHQQFARRDTYFFAPLV